MTGFLQLVCNIDRIHWAQFRLHCYSKREHCIDLFPSLVLNLVLVIYVYFWGSSTNSEYWLHTVVFWVLQLQVCCQLYKRQHSHFEETMLGCSLGSVLIQYSDVFLMVHYWLLIAGLPVLKVAIINLTLILVVIQGLLHLFQRPWAVFNVRRVWSIIIVHKFIIIISCLVKHLLALYRNMYNQRSLKSIHSVTSTSFVQGVGGGRGLRVKRCDFLFIRACQNDDSYMFQFYWAFPLLLV